MMRSLFLVLVFFALTANSFTSVKKASFVKAAVSKRVFLQMSNEPETPPKTTDKTFYDDEVDSTPIKPQLSETMRERLLREAQVGLDADKPQTNVLLYIMAAVAVLVVLGGKDVLY